MRAGIFIFPNIKFLLPNLRKPEIGFVLLQCGIIYIICT